MSDARIVYTGQRFDEISVDGQDLRLTLNHLSIVASAPGFHPVVQINAATVGLDQMVLELDAPPAVLSVTRGAVPLDAVLAAVDTVPEGLLLQAYASGGMATSPWVAVMAVVKDWIRQEIG